MKILAFLLLIIAVLAIAGGAGTIMVRDPGLVSIVYGGYAFETGLWTFLVVAIGLWLLMRLLISTLVSLLSGFSIFGRFRAKRQRKSAKRQTEQGLLLMAEEEWADARKSLVSGAKGAAAPLLNFLQAAYASNELGQTKRRDELLQKALKATPEAQFGLDLAAVRMQLASSEVGDGAVDETDQALETLLQLRDQAPRHQIVAEFIARAYEKKEDYSKLESQLGSVKRMRKEHPGDIQRMETKIAKHKILGAFEKDADASGAVAVWKRQDKAIRLQPEFVQEVAGTLTAAGASEQAGELLIDALAAQWNPDWLNQFVNLPGIEKLQASQAASWLKSNSSDPVVLLLAARAEAAKGEWQKSLKHATKADEIAPSAAIRVELARAEAALQTSEQKQEPDQETDGSDTDAAEPDAEDKANAS